MQINSRFTLSVVIFIAFLALVEHYFGWSTLLRPWRDLSLGLILLAITIVFASYCLRAYRLFDYFKTEMAGAFSLCFKVMLQHNLLNNILPMRTGEISFPVLTSRYFSIPVKRSIPALLWFRILDLHTLGIFALWATAGYWFNQGVVIILLLFWSALPWLFFHLSARLTAYIGENPQRRLAAITKKILDGLPRSQPVFWRSWAWTLINWLVKLAIFTWILLLFIDVPVSAALMGAIAGDLTSVLPIHGVAGAGTYEAGVVAGLLPYDVDPENALGSAINLHLFILASTVIGGAISLLIPGKRSNG
ncbi:MAG: lysylphosphatidylglycerol synthase transmembrane domain-containing protein [Gammaproteobacteria bacterium]